MVSIDIHNTRKVTARSRKPILLVAFALALTAASQPRSVVASCTSYMCQAEYCRSDLDLLRRFHHELVATETDFRTSDYPQNLADNAAGCQRVVAAYDSRLRWERQPLLEVPTPELERRARAEHRQWLEALIASIPAPETRLVCRLGQAQDTPEERLAFFEREHAAHKADTERTECLAHELVAQARRNDAELLLRIFLDEHPEPRAFEDLEASLAQRGAKAEAAALLHEAASRRPENLQDQIALLSHYADTHQDAERDALVADLESRFRRAQERYEICDAAGYRRDREAPTVLACLQRIVDVPPAPTTAASLQAGSPESGNPPADPKEDKAYRQIARDRLLFSGIHAHDWNRIASLLPSYSDAELLQTWGQLLDWLKNEACPNFLAAYRAGRLGVTLDPSKNEPTDLATLSRFLGQCGATEDAERLRDLTQPALEAEFLPWLQRDDEPELRRRLALDPSNARLYHLLVKSLDSDSTGGKAAVLEQWSQRAPTDPDPVVQLARLSVEAGQCEAALHWWDEAVRRKPDDLDLLVQKGVAALRCRNDTVAERISKALLSSRQASGRQVAEGHYLLGRAAQRLGNQREAAGHLITYFLDRLRYAGCFADQEEKDLTCDEPLAVFLLATNDSKQTARYLEGRTKAIAYHKNFVVGVSDLPGHGHREWSIRSSKGPCVSFLEEQQARREAGLDSRQTPAACLLSSSVSEAPFPDAELLGFVAALNLVR
jgi:hypothetical protein